MRDAISILERCTGEQKGLIDEDQVRELVGIPKTMQIYEIVKGILEHNCDIVIEVTNNIINAGKDVDNFLWEIIKYIKDLLVYKSSKSLEIYNAEEKEQMIKLSENVSKERLLQLIYDLSELANNIKWSSQKVVMFQAGMIKSCLEIDVGSAKCEVGNVNSNNVKTSDLVQDIKPTQKSVGATSSRQQNTATVAKPKPTRPGKNLPYWNNVIDKIKQSGKMGIYVNLIGSTAKEINDMVIEVDLANKNSFAKQILETHENKAEIEKIVSIEVGKTMSVRFSSGENKTETKASTNSIENIANDMDIPFNIIDE